MSIHDIVTNQLIKHEGIRLKPYRCSEGKLTIGIGRNLESRGITESEAKLMLKNDIDLTIYSLLKTIPDIYNALSDNRKAVLINMAFNLGLQGFLEFRNMLKALKDGDYDKTAAEMLDSKWAKQVWHRANELADLMIKG